MELKPERMRTARRRYGRSLAVRDITVAQRGPLLCFRLLMDGVPLSFVGAWHG
jgi:hypothetical protein